MTNITTNMFKDTNVEIMVGALEEFYECAGFDNYYERVLSKMDEEQIRHHFKETFEDMSQDDVKWFCEEDV